MSANHDGAHEHHVMSIQTHIAVFGALLTMTVLTYAVSFLELEQFALPVAMLVASIKALLVAGFFMHLRWDEKFNSVIFFSSFFFIGVFFAFTLLDLGGRGMVNEEEEHGFYDAEIEALELEEARRAEEAAQ